MQHLSKPELLALLKAAKAESERDWLMILTAFWHGLRAAEVVGQSQCDVKPGAPVHPGIRVRDIVDGHITVRRLKGSLKTTQRLMSHENPLLDERTALEQFVAGLPAKAKLFDISRVQFFRLMRHYCKRAGVPARKSSPHKLKHTCAMLFIKEAGIEHVRQHLGHRSIASTGEYLKVSDEQASQAIATAVGAAL